MTPSSALLFRLDLVVGALVLVALALVLLAVAVNPVVGVVGGLILLGVVLVGVYSYLNGVRAYAEATTGNASR
ncbi:hypothetical protein C2R22_19815 [Salinigranum rubrum]|jgi:uncharacterized Tic20 family protein|uniref:Uncharacterized protein n=1 Tax=Salinigranum rubrum TaxID=755307 RepID=A0A2I8VNW9_9EURY|nr:hypothetical protein [Salinigranum rubrum]AUV83613.1 hypothetical protein C2R22_19815 [Salinigranum rubrum]